MYNQSVNQPVNQQFNQPQQVQKQSPIVFDSEVKEILNNTYPEMINALVNISIKKFAKTSEYKNYFLIKDYRESFEVQEEQEEVQIEAPVSQPQPQPEPQSSSVISAVSAW